MKNRILYLTRNTIPYVKELQPIAGTVAGCILMQQLDYWFERRPNGFWKFLESSTHPSYRNGDSWVEELGMSAEEFRTAFDKIGVRYKSKSQFDKMAQDKFQGKYYCSYLDRRANLTYYFRNHGLADKALDALIFNTEQSVTVNQESGFTVNQESGFTGNQESQFQGIEKVDIQEIGNPDFNTETTSTEITQRLLPQQSAISSEMGSSESALFFPKVLAQEVRVSVEKEMERVKDTPLDRQQALLDELENAIIKKMIRSSILSFFHTLVDRELEGKFTPSGGIEILAERNAVKRKEAVVRSQSQRKIDHDPAACEIGARVLSKILAKGVNQRTKLGKQAERP